MSSLPKGWTLTPISSVATYNPKTDAPESTESAFSPMQCLGTTFRKQLNFEIKAWGDIKKAYTHFQSGDVLMAKVTPCFENGKAGIATNLPNGIGAGSSEFMVFRPTEAVLNRYLLGWLSTHDFRRRATVAMTGSVGLKRVPKDFVLNEQLPFAPLAEQMRIADKLDATLALVDACRERLARVAPILKRFRQSVLAAATSGQLTVDWREQQGYCQGNIGPHGDTIEDDQNENIFRKLVLSNDDASVTFSIPEKWHWASLHGGILSANYGTSSKSNKEGDLPVLRMGNLQGGKLDWSGLVYSNDENENVKYALKSGDILFNRTNSPELVGKTSIYRGERPAIYAGYLIRVQTNPLYLLPEYLNICLNSPYGKDYCWAVKSDGVSQSNINAEKLKNLPVPYCSLIEQTEIVRRVETLLAFADRLEARLASAAAAAERLTPSLLAKAFRGELVPQDPNDEPASELLKRLSAQREAAPKAKRTKKSVTTTN